jgi:Flp pilus assembly protein TadG
MQRIKTRFRSNNSGATSVEMAFILPALLLFTLGLMEFCRAYWVLDSMRLSVDEAGRYAMLNVAATDTQITTNAKAKLYSLDPTKFTVTSTSQTSSGVNYKLITATYTFSFVASGLLPFGNINFSKSTRVPLIP